MVVTGEDTQISIGGTSYSVYIDSYDESGGENQIQVVRTFGNNYEDVVTGVDDYQVSFNFRVNSTTLKTLFENTTPVTIIITIGSDATITYNNMRPLSLKYEVEPTDIAQGTLSYQSPAFEGGTNNRVIS